MRIFVPGRGYIDMEFFNADKAANEYDERLFFDVHPETGDYCVFIKMPHGVPPYPVLGFGRVIPDRDEMHKQLYLKDGLRRGEQIIDMTLRDMQAEKDATEKYMQEVSAEVAEIEESFNHRMGRMEKYHRSHSREHDSKRTGGQD